MKKLKKSQGFTLIELIVSISIIAVITGLFLTDYKSANRTAMLSAATDHLVSDLRLVQSYALGAKLDKTGKVPRGGWCINFDSPKNYYTIFADANGDHQQAAGAAEDYRQVIVDPTNRIQIVGAKPFNPRKDYYEIYNGTVLAGEKKQMDICYETPVPTVYITGYPSGIATGTNTQIKFIDTTNNLSMKILVNNFGLIDKE